MNSLVGRLKRYHTTLGVLSPAYRSLVSSIYLTPNPLRRRLSDGDASLLGCLTRLRRDGVVAFDETFPELADALTTSIIQNPPPACDDVSSPSYFKDILTADSRTAGLAFFAEISPMNPIVMPFFSHDRLVRLVCDYYGRQAYYRNFPVVTQTSVKETFAIDATYKFHVDYRLKQVSMMLLLCDVTRDDTHMIYATGSHRSELPNAVVRDRNSFDDAEVFAKYRMTELTGKRGTLWIFDAGNGLHRANPKPGTTRRILHMNVTTGHYMLVDKRVGAPLRHATSALPVHVRRAFQRLAD